PTSPPRPGSRAPAAPSSWCPSPGRSRTPDGRSSVSEQTAAGVPSRWRSRGLPGLAADAFLRRREATILLVAVGLLIYFQSSKSVFLTHDNLVNVSQGTAPYAIVAVG